MRAYFAGGCFWCITPVFKIYGADSVICGYSGGEEKEPTYKDVKSQKTGHRETVMVEYDPEKVTYDRLLDIYLANIDPYDDGGQFIDRGHSYTLAVYYSTSDEKEKVLSRIRELERQSGRKTCIAVEPFAFFWPAENEHQDYYLKEPEAFEKEMRESGRKK